MRRRGLRTLVAVLALAAAGCTSTPDDEAARPTMTTTVTRAPQPQPTPISPVTDPPSTAALAWAQGTRLHVGAQVADLAPLHVDAFALTRGGVFVLNHNRLWLTDLSQAHDTGYRRVRSLTVSPDGRYLGFVDLPTFAREPGAVAVATVYDTTTGRPVVASTLGMGDPTKEDLPALYETAAPQPLGFLADGRFVARTPHGTYAFPLGHGRPQRLSGGWVPTSTQGGTAVRPNRVEGPGHRFGLDDPQLARFRPYDVATGAPVLVAAAPRVFRAGVWTSPSRVDGVVLSRRTDGRPEGIVRCDLAARRCHTVVAAGRLGPGQVALATGAVPRALPGPGRGGG